MVDKKLFPLQLLFIIPIVGLILGSVWAKLDGYGWFRSSWQMVAQPPVYVSSLEAIHRDGLWVRSNSGDIYYIENASQCVNNCWHKVDEIPKLPISDNSLYVSNKPCTRMLPLWGVVATISECRTESWNQLNNTFALLNDGTIRLWQVNHSRGEGVWLINFVLPIFCALALFLPILLYVLYTGFLGWLSNKARSKQANNAS